MSSFAATHASYEEAAFRPVVQRPGLVWWGLFTVLSAAIVVGAVAYAYQLREGLNVTGLNQRVSWGFYISNLVFFIGISYGGAITSAILRLTNAPWRAPLTRMAEGMAVASLVVGAVFPIIDLGRPDHMYQLFVHGQVGSPVLWDVVAISTYLVASLVFIYLPLIPDIALCRDRLASSAGPVRRLLYRGLSLGWKGTGEQRRVLNMGMTVLAILIIPLAVSVHSVLAWLFGVTVRPGWDSTIFAPYFVMGAMYSGVGSVILVMAAFRWAYHLDAYITPKHFRYLGYMLLVLGMGYLYFMVAEYLTEGYKLHQQTGDLLELVMLGKLASLFWLFVIGGLLLPIAVVAIPATRTVPFITLAALAAVLGMWLKRFLIVVPSLAESLSPTTKLTIYHPTWVEISITIAAAAAIPWLLMVFFRLFPIISVFEMDEVAEAEERKAEELGAAPVQAMGVAQ
ncbi:MAG: polysulfide reductase NrfD [Dehalococcoidia bacterium]|nr:polysulfide reductase NrfD [Dehalococcoidia bacterium]